ncbi:hypothetical protein [Helicobacter trogontum]
MKMRLQSLVRKTSLYKKYQAKREAKMNDEEYFIYRHKKIFGYTPNFRNPQTFNEKIIHRILFDRNPIYTALADKLKARIYIAERLKDFHVKNTLDSKHVDVRSHATTSFHSNATDHNDDSCNSMSGGDRLLHFI